MLCGRSSPLLKQILGLLRRCEQGLGITQHGLDPGDRRGNRQPFNLRDDRMGGGRVAGMDRRLHEIRQAEELDPGIESRIGRREEPAKVLEGLP